MLEPLGSNNMQRDDYEVQLFIPPLRVVLSGYLNGRGESEGEGDDGFVMSDTEELS